ncbi:MAG: hypothetical protein ACE147_13890 [Candidatus Methylomirabilales bacterium]
MASGGRRDEVDTRLKAWEEELELLRVRLAAGAEALHAKHGATFQELYRRKETLRSRWEAIRGVYRPEPEAVRRFEEALAAMEAAWSTAEPMVGEVLGMQPRPR